MLKINAGGGCEFAAAELASYGERVFSDYASVDSEIVLSVFSSESAADEIRIDVRGGSGVISGNGTCALLIAVYRFLRECGCRFLRPGKDGEYLPRVLISEVNISLCERADSEIRCMIVEGACSFENVVVYDVNFSNNTIMDMAYAKGEVYFENCVFSHVRGNQSIHFDGQEGANRNGGHQHR